MVALILHIFLDKVSKTHFREVVEFGRYPEHVYHNSWRQATIRVLISYDLILNK